MTEQKPSLIIRPACLILFATLLLSCLTPVQAAVFSNSSGSLKFDLPERKDQKIYTELISVFRRTKTGSYAIWVPGELMDYWRDLFLYLAWDQEKNRIDYFHAAFLDAIIQPELTLRTNSDGAWKKRIKTLLGHAETSAANLSDFADVVDKSIDATKKTSFVYKLSPKEAKKVLTSWGKVSKSKHLGQSLDTLGKALGGITIACRIGSDIFNQMLIHAVSNADAYERLAILEQTLLTSYKTSDPEYQGFLKAKTDALYYIQESCNQFKVAINNILENAPSDIIYMADLGIYLAKYWNLISKGSAATLTKVILPYALSAETAVTVKKDIDLIRECCAIATLHHKLDAAYNQVKTEFEKNNSPLTETGFEAANNMLKLSQMRIALSYSYHNSWDILLDREIVTLNPGEWIHNLMDLITARWKKVSDFQDTLKRYKNRLTDQSMAYVPYMDQHMETKRPIEWKDEFTKNMGGWVSRLGNWGIQASQYLSTTGLPRKMASICHDSASKNVDIEVKMKRSGNSTYSQGICIRGDNTTLAKREGLWSSGYFFGYVNKGYFTVGEMNNGRPNLIKKWAKSSAINKGQWNRLRVVAKDALIKFYINDNLVFQKTGIADNEGQMGLMVYSRKKGDCSFLVDWIKYKNPDMFSDKAYQLERHAMKEDDQQGAWSTVVDNNMQGSEPASNDDATVIDYEGPGNQATGSSLLLFETQ